MKSNIKHLLFIFCFLWITVGYSQQYSNGQFAIKGTGSLTLPLSWGANVGIEKNIGLTRHSLGAEFMLLNMNKDIYEDRLKILTTNLNLIYNYSFLQWKFINISVGAGISIGGKSYSNKNGLINITKTSQLSCGPLFHIGTEFSISESIALLCRPSYFLDLAMTPDSYFLSSSARNSFLLQLGFKFYL